ncbi:hypothetical protein AX14_009382 [Amanita brunnescens Koide BX004]|nr:hypothetical protein AX14_009382 [Amanita brunnescens Koide BX004]
MCSNNREFIWTAFQDECFNKIKKLVAKAPACRPINSKSGEKIWVISDASATGIGAWYGQGPTWDACRPAGFISRKFTPAQMNYCTWEQELLGVLEALLRWEDKLLGLPFTIVTDHQALTFFNEAPTRSQRRMRWWEYIGRFDFKMQYLKGEKNKVADSLSRYFANDKPDEKHDVSAYVNADARLDPEGEDLTIARTAELFALKVDLHDEAGYEERIRDHVEPRTIEAEQLSANKETSDETLPNIDLDSGAIKDIFRAITRAYKTDHFFSRIWKKPSQFNKFRLQKNLLWTDNRTGNRVTPAIRRQAIQASIGPPNTFGSGSGGRAWLTTSKSSASPAGGARQPRRPDGNRRDGYTQCLFPRDHGKALVWTSLVHS